ncbi:DUF1329 domain-containing protein [Cupriavidus necator]
MKNPIHRILAVALGLLATVPALSIGAVSPQEAATLKTTLTPLGAERAGNKEGTIPAWTGGYTAGSGTQKSEGRRIDPFAADKPLFTITAANASKYSEHLSEGVMALFQRYPETFRINVYPTRRTAAAPQWLYNNTLRNATQAKLSKDGLAVEGAYGGVPFPIPKSGEEVRWNHLTRWRGQSIDMRYKVWANTPSGQSVLATQATVNDQFPYYREPAGDGAKHDGMFWQSIQSTDAPAFRAGEALLLRDQNDFSDGRMIWQYLAGQRRVRRAPNIGFDTPDFVASGTSFFDEAFGGVGSSERYDLKLLGKKEMYIPYNTNRLLTISDAEAMAKNHLKPENLRWELHRVWVVEATLKAGKRHAVPRRISYHDEDTWATSVMDGWDAQGKIWRTDLMLPFVAPELPAVVTMCTDAFFNLQTGAWLYRCSMGDFDEQYKAVPYRADSYFTPDALVSNQTR